MKPTSAALALILLLAGAGSAAGQPASIAGVVWDSVAHAPLAGARVELSGTRSWAISGEDGTYRIDHPNAGRYQLTFAHPRLDSLGIGLEPLPVELVRGEATSAELAIPPLREVQARLCGAEADPAAAIVVGRVRGPDGEGIEGIRVVLEWERFNMTGGHTMDVGRTTTGEEAVTGPGGRYHACAVVLDRRVTVRAGDERRLHRVGVLRLGTPTIHVHDIRLP